MGACEGGEPYLWVMALQKEEAKTLTLLDDDSRAVLGLLRRAGVEPLQRSAASHRHRAPLASDITNCQHKVR